MWEILNSISRSLEQLRGEVGDLRGEVGDLRSDVTGLKDQLQNYCSQNVFDRVAKSMVAIFRVEANGEEQCIGGACIYSDSINQKRILLTSAHVLFDETVDQSTSNMVHTWCASGGQRLQIRRCSGQLRQDLLENQCIADHQLDIVVAGLKCSESLGLERDDNGIPPPFKKPDLLLCGLSMVNADFQSNPFPKPNLITNISIWSNGDDVVSYSGKSFRGDSGCPVINREGKIVAIHCGTDDDQQKRKQGSRGEGGLESSMDGKHIAGDTLCVGVLATAIDRFIQRAEVKEVTQSQIVDFETPIKSSQFGSSRER